MAVTINASTSSGLVQTADTSGVLTIQNNGTNALTVDSGNLQFNSGYGSVATAYGCRAWVNFNGTGTVAIRASGNVSSITDNGTGNYTVNFTTAMPDVNYSAIVDVGGTPTANFTAWGKLNGTTPLATGSVTVNVIGMGTSGNTYTPNDIEVIAVAVFR